MSDQRWICVLARICVLIGFPAVASGQQIMSSRAQGHSIFANAGEDARRVARSLDARGISLHSIFVNDLSKSPFHSHGDHSWFSRYSVDVSTDIDGEKAMQWKGASFHLDVKRHARVSGQMYSDVAQGYSNIDADSRTYVYEAWAMQSLAHDHIEVQAGQIDANTRFATVTTAADFLNSSMGYSPTIMNFPTYPAPKPGVDVLMTIPASIRIAAGEFRVDGGRMALAEADKGWGRESGRASGDVELGYWRLQQPLITRDSEHVRGTAGFYAVLEQQLWSGSRGTDSGTGRKLTGFLQMGTGDGQENSFTSHLGFGLVLQAPFLRRTADSMGIAATQAGAAGDPDDGARAHKEIVSEEYYKLALKTNLALIVDAQYFTNPGAGGHCSPFFVLTPRLVMTF